eukprot:1159598-Pelagomonas_calceolata.AAC.2
MHPQVAAAGSGATDRGCGLLTPHLAPRQQARAGVSQQARFAAVGQPARGQQAQPCGGGCWHGCSCRVCYVPGLGSKECPNWA